MPPPTTARSQRSGGARPAEWPSLDWSRWAAGPPCSAIHQCPRTQTTDASKPAFAAPDPVRYCERCIIPDTRPGVEIGDDGVCSACAAHGRKLAEVDWVERAARFRELVAEVRALGRRWDCVIPVSGG